jgi:hypothetical protein
MASVASLAACRACAALSRGGSRWWCGRAVAGWGAGRSTAAGPPCRPTMFPIEGGSRTLCAKSRGHVMHVSREAD